MLLKIILKYEVSINTSIHLGMRIYFFFYISLQYLINKNDFFILIIALTLWWVRPKTSHMHKVIKRLKVKLGSCSGSEEIYKFNKNVFLKKKWFKKRKGQSSVRKLPVTEQLSVAKFYHYTWSGGCLISLTTSVNEPRCLTACKMFSHDDLWHLATVSLFEWEL